MGVKGLTLEDEVLPASKTNGDLDALTSIDLGLGSASRSSKSGRGDEKWTNITSSGSSYRSRGHLVQNQKKATQLRGKVLECALQGT